MGTRGRVSTPRLPLKPTALSLKPAARPRKPASLRTVLPLAGRRVRRDTGRVRTVRTAAAAVTAVLAAGAASVAPGPVARDAAPQGPPGRPLPTEPRLTVHATAAGQVALTRDLAALRPGTYGLAGQ